MKTNFIREPIDKYKFSIPRGRVYVIPDRCKQCTYCWELCPHNVLEMSDQRNIKGYHYPRVRADKVDDCIDCSMCERVCPEFAIFTIELKDKPSLQEVSL